MKKTKSDPSVIQLEVEVSIIRAFEGETPEQYMKDFLKNPNVSGYFDKLRAGGATESDKDLFQMVVREMVAKHVYIIYMDKWRKHFIKKSLGGKESTSSQDEMKKAIDEANDKLLKMDPNENSTILDTPYFDSLIKENFPTINPNFRLPE